MLADKSGSDEYSEDNYDENDFDEAEDAEADLKLEKLRKAMAREANNANRVVSKAKIVVKKQELGKPVVLKMGPATGKGTVTMDQINQNVANMDYSKMVTPQTIIQQSQQQQFGSP